MNLRGLVVLLAACAMLAMSSCKVLYPNVLLTTDQNYKFDTLVLDSTKFSTEYRLAPNDIIEFRLFANDGFKMIDLIASGGSTQNNQMVRQGFEYYLDARGQVKLPILGMVTLDSMTIREAEAYLETRYATYYVKPFVILRVVNRRVIVFPGEAGNAKVVGLSNNNTTVIEAIALAGGISQNGKAHKIRLIRQTTDPANPKVYKIDLSKMDYIAQGNIVVQSNDIIYIEPKKRYAARTLQEVSPFLSLLSATLTVYFLISRT
jgi:polysaccharide export outer membrane protein